MPGYLHDTFSSWHPMFVTGPAYAALGEMLHRHWLEYRNTDGWVTASVADDGRTTLAHRDPERTAAEFTHPEDRSAYLTMLQRVGENIASIGGLLSSEMRSFALVRHISSLIHSSGLRGAEWWLRAAVTSGRAYARRDFRGHEVDHLYATVEGGKDSGKKHTDHRINNQKTICGARSASGKLFDHPHLRV